MGWAGIPPATAGDVLASADWHCIDLTSPSGGWPATPSHQMREMLHGRAGTGQDWDLAGDAIADQDACH